MRNVARPAKAGLGHHIETIINHSCRSHRTRAIGSCASHAVDRSRSVPCGSGRCRQTIRRRSIGDIGAVFIVVERLIRIILKDRRQVLGRGQ